MAGRGVIAGRVVADGRLVDFKVTAWRSTLDGLRRANTVSVSVTGKFTFKALEYGDYLLVAHPEYDKYSVEPVFAPAAYPQDALTSHEYLRLDSERIDGVEIPVEVGAVLEIFETHNSSTSLLV